MSDLAAFWDGIADRYVAKPVADQAAYAFTLERTRAHLRPEDRALELGAGSGATALALAPSVKHITATDVSTRMIELGRDRARAEGVKNVDFAIAEALEAPGLAGGYDVILAYNLLHLVPDLGKTLAFAHRNLKTGGRFISKTRCRPGIVRHLLTSAVVGVMRALGKAPFVRFMTVEELDAAIEAAGFKIVETFDRPKSPPAHFVVAEKVRELPSERRVIR